MKLTRTKKRLIDVRMVRIGMPRGESWTSSAREQKWKCSCSEVAGMSCSVLMASPRPPPLARHLIGDIESSDASASLESILTRTGKLQEEIVYLLENHGKVCAVPKTSRLTVDCVSSHPFKELLCPLSSCYLSMRLCLQSCPVVRLCLWSCPF